MSDNGLVLIQKAWNGYVKNGVLDLQLVRPDVANSWNRCRLLNVNPFEVVEKHINKRDLKERLYKKEYLIKVARPFMDNLYNFVRGSGFQAVLTDEQGFLLEVLGDNEIVSRTQQIHLCPGGNWSELARGTNAIGTAIVEKKPVQIYAWEHYCRPHHFLTCSASPIFDPDGAMIGVLNLSGDYHVANPHTLGMVVAAVNAIESQLRLFKATEKLYFAYKYSNALLENMSDGLISINVDGFITEINAKAAALLAVNPNHVKGRHVEQIDSIKSLILQVITDGVGYEDREILVKNTARKIYSSASLLRDDNGGIIGAVAVFREISKKLPAKLNSTTNSRLYTFDDIVGESMAMIANKTWAKLAAATSSTILINGESGTGKELFAQSIHNASPRSERPFIAINCAAMPENLIESELFGYEEGTFTGSKRGGHAGKFEVADGGTIFLDEIGDMSLLVQAKLLRVIQEKRIVRVGSAYERAVDIRIIAATHKDLFEEVHKGNFRQDLYYRLNVLEIRIPPLRARLDDLPAIARRLVEKISARLGKKNFLIEDAFYKKIQSHYWPGNIRELENVLERAIVKSGEDDVLMAELLDFNQADQNLDSEVTVKPTALRSLRDTEKEMISEALIFYGGNIKRAADKLGIGRNTLYRKMKEYCIL